LGGVFEHCQQVDDVVQPSAVARRAVGARQALGRKTGKAHDNGYAAR
jgi:hypothetical protein